MRFDCCVWGFLLREDRVTQASLALIIAWGFGS